MYYVYILWSSKSRIFYTGYTENLKQRFEQHNNGLSQATKPHRPWRLIFYAAFDAKKKAKDFELYLKSGSGKAFASKHLIDVALKED